ncbi:MAG: hypothetical protein KF774_21590 [Planctomyces sp.]|nr:hypothetical protein [Planctomyces sp.]
MAKRANVRPPVDMYALNILKKSRKQVQAGDYFVCQPVDGPYCFGRVVRPDAAMLGWQNCVLCYIYEPVSDVKVLPAGLSRDRLLIPPFFTDMPLWTCGHFEPLGSAPLGEGDRFPMHYFRNSPDDSEFTYNELGELAEPGPGPIGETGLWTQFGVAKRIAKSLAKRGIHLTPNLESRDLTKAAVAAETEEDDDAGGEQSVTIQCVGTRQLKKGQDGDIMELEDALEQALAAADTGWLDGHGLPFDAEGVDFFLYGPDADKLLKSVLKVVKKWGFPRVEAIKTYGPPGSKEQRVTISGP